MKPKSCVVSDVSYTPRALDLRDLRQRAEADRKAGKPEFFMSLVQRAVQEEGLRWEHIRNLRETFQALAGFEVPVYQNVSGQQRAIMTSAFPALAGALTMAGFTEAYEALPTIGQELVTEMDDPLTNTTVPEITSLDTNVAAVAEMADYPEIGAGEIVYDIGSLRNGRRMSVSMETIERNQVSDITNRIDALAEIASELIEVQTIRRVCDIDGSGTTPAEPYVLHLKHAGTALYSVTANAPDARCPSGTRIANNALVDTTDLENARVVLAAMLNSRGRRISIPMSRCTLLVPDALNATGFKILGSEYESGVENELSAWGPRGTSRPRLLSSPLLDDLSTTAWYLGWFQRQFTRKWALRLEYVTLQGNTADFLRRRVGFEARIAWDVEIGARNVVYVVQSLAASTAP